MSKDKEKRKRKRKEKREKRKEKKTRKKIEKKRKTTKDEARRTDTEEPASIALLLAPPCQPHSNRQDQREALSSYSSALFGCAAAAARNQEKRPESKENRQIQKRKQQHATARNSKAKPAQLVSKLQQRPAKERHSQKQRGSNNKNQHRKQTDTDEELALAMLA